MDIVQSSSYEDYPKDRGVLMKIIMRRIEEL